MTDEKRIGKHPVSFSMSTGDDISVIAGDDDEQLVDVTKTFEKLGEEKIDSLVDGVETYFTKGVLDKKLLEILKISGTEHFDPMPSRRNAILGGENFIVTMRDKFIDFIKMIIEAIKKAFNWMLDKVKGFFGWGKTQERIKEMEVAGDKIKDELMETFRRMKINPSCYNLERLWDAKPQGLSRVETIQYLQTQIGETEETFDGLVKSGKVLQDIQKEVLRKQKDVVNFKRSLHRELDNIRKSLSKNLISEHQVVGLMNLIREGALKTYDYDRLYEKFNDLIILVYGIKLNPNQEDFKTNLMTKISAAGSVVKGKIKSDVVNGLSEKISENLAYLADLPITKIMADLTDQETKDILRVDDATLINEITNRFPDMIEGLSIKDAYAHLCNRVNDYTQTTTILIKVAKDVAFNITGFLTWKQRADALLAAYATNDVELMIAAREALLKDGVDITDITTVIVPPEDKSSFIKGTGAVAEELIKHNVNGMGRAVRNLMRQLSLSPGGVFNG